MRIKLDLSSLFPDSDTALSLLLIPSTVLLVSDLVRLIQTRYRDLGNLTLVLRVQGFSVPEDQSVNILKEDEVVQVQRIGKRKRESEREESKCEPEKQKIEGLSSIGAIGSKV